jgi:protein-S-isoprenylcysteine O-methyltransferase Ste14
MITLKSQLVISEVGKLGATWMAKKRVGSGSEHPYCDRIQLVLIVLFFVVWTMDLVGFFVFGYSTVLFAALPIPVNLAFTPILFIFGLYLTNQSDKLVFHEQSSAPKLIDSGVYSRVRHPMYLGVLLNGLAFFFISLSVLSLIVLIALFIFYDRMAAYEEKDLIRIFGEEYIAYQKRVPKWLPRITAKR